MFTSLGKIRKSVLFNIVISTAVQFLILSSFIQQCESKEIELTNEWYLLKENETVPRGVHAKIDMTTGEKWVKLADEKENDNNKNKGLIVSKKEENANDKIVQSVLEADGSLTILPDDDDKEEDVLEKYEYIGEDTMTIHRTLSHLPQDEQARIGGLPELPSLPSSSRSNNITKEEYKKFELKLKEIWKKRQEELSQAQDELVADIPSIFRDRIKDLQSYIDHGYTISNNDNSNDDVISEILFILKELEYDLSDIDMSRDFYTLGGWDVLVSLLTKDVHNNAVIKYQQEKDHVDTDVDTDTVQYPMEKIQTAAAWVIGTAIKNTDEFHPWIIQPTPHQKNALELLLLNIIDCTKPSSESSTTTSLNIDKYVYAIGCALRGNTLIMPKDVTLTLTNKNDKNDESNNNTTTVISLESILYEAGMSSLKYKRYNTISKLLLLTQDLNLNNDNDDNNNDWCAFIISSIDNYTTSSNINCLDRSLSWQEKMLHSLKYACSNNDKERITIMNNDNAKKLLRSNWIQCWYHHDSTIDVDWRTELIDLINTL